MIRNNIQSPGLHEYSAIVEVCDVVPTQEKITSGVDPKPKKGGGGSIQDGWEVCLGDKSESPSHWLVSIPLDPLTLKPIHEPVIAPDGISYSLGSLLSYLVENDNRLPGWHDRINPDELLIERWLRNRIDAFKTGTSFANDLCCPITRVTFEDPVVGSDGHTYELDAIRREFHRTGLSPITREVLKPFVYRNLGVASLVSTGNQMRQRPEEEGNSKVVLGVSRALINGPVQVDHSQIPLELGMEQQRGPRIMRSKWGVVCGILGYAAGVSVTSLGLLNQFIQPSDPNFTLLVVGFGFAGALGGGLLGRAITKLEVLCCREIEDG